MDALKTSTPMVVLALVLATVLAALAGLYRRGTAEDAIPTRERPFTDADAADLIERGRYLARIGDCVACHTAPGAAEYAGGRAIPTPFGTLYGPNLTPDRETGLGRWNADDFWHALHDGKSRDGSLLYPAFPYDGYTRVSRDDADAIFAFLRSLPPVRQQNRPPELRFPYDQRPLLAFWRALYFRPGVFEPDARRSAAYNRGAYLVDGLGHCGACHSPRNGLGAPDPDRPLSGSVVLGWYAPALDSAEVAGIALPDPQPLVDLLRTGISSHATAAGPMAEVVYLSLQHLYEPDARAIASYLRERPGAQVETLEPRALIAASDRRLAEGAGVYREHCQSCHGADGEGAPPAYPPLARNPAVTQRSAMNPLQMVVHGGFPPGTAGNPRPYGMPPFGQLLNEAQIAAVTTYVRNSWGNHARGVSAADVRR